MNRLSCSRRLVTSLIILLAIFVYNGVFFIISLFLAGLVGVSDNFDYFESPQASCVVATCLRVLAELLVNVHHYRVASAEISRG